MQKFLSKVNQKWVALGAFLSMALVAGPASATPTYDVSPVTSGVTTELASNLPTILGIVGGLIALGIAVRAVRKFAKV